MPDCPTCGKPLPANGVCSDCAEFDTRTVAASAAQSAGTSSPPRAPSDGSRFVPGTLLAERYRIIALLGRGGMGEVYRADDLTLGQSVALKFLPPSLSRSEDAIRRFRNEVRIARQVSHPNVCRVYDVGEIDGHFFLSMEYVDGEDLASLLRRIGRLPSDKALEIARKLCAGLAAAHQKGVLHRDLKPGNIMLDGRGNVLLTDFGLAGIAGDIAGRDVSSGTPAYMAPEQLSGREVTARSDIYSLGLVFYEIFTGRRPFEGSTLQELIRLRSASAPESPASFVRDLDPVVETVILRCLEANPAQRPASALAVSAALPGGDPLAAALAAGETPSPQMVAAAGEGAGIAPRAAAAVFAAILVGMFVTGVLGLRTSALERIRPEYSPDVLVQKAKDIAGAVGYNSHPADWERGFRWDYPLVGYIEEHEKPGARWSEALAANPSVLRLWYRQHDEVMTAMEFHSDLLTPGEITDTDPAPIYSGMVSLELDSRGHLMSFTAVPPQVQPQDHGGASPVDWSPLFAAAGLDTAALEHADPRWTWLATSDERAAWTGTWPGTSRPLRIEAAALRGRPVAFAVLGDWVTPDRMPSTDQGREDMRAGIYGVLGLVICFSATWLARRNLAAGRGDRRGAFRLAVFIFIVHMALWVTRTHLVLSSGLMGMFILALCTSLFYGLVLWTVYLALEPYVRRTWPRTLISWTRVLSGQWRDPIVGRDVLFGAGMGVVWILTGRIADLFESGFSAAPTWTAIELLLGVRSALGAWLARGPHTVRDALLFFFLLFLLRILLRNQWLGAAAFVIILTIPQLLHTDQLLIQGAASTIIYGLAALIVIRLGLLALTAGFCTAGLIGPPPTLQTGAWYFTNIAFLFASALALVAWAFYTSTGGRRFWSDDHFA